MKLEQAQVVKENFKLTTIKVRKEYDELKDINMATVKPWNEKPRGPEKKNMAKTSSEELYGAATTILSSEEPKRISLGRRHDFERRFKSCHRSKRSLSQQLSKTEGNMWAIIDEYKGKLDLATTHEQKLENKYAKVLVLQAEREARERVIDSLHKEAMMWMDRFAFTLNGSQDLPRLLAKAKAMADVYSAPEEILELLNYCQHMIDLMAHIIRSR